MVSRLEATRPNKLSSRSAHCISVRPHGLKWRDAISEFRKCSDSRSAHFHPPKDNTGSREKEKAAGSFSESLLGTALPPSFLETKASEREAPHRRERTMWTESHLNSRR